MGTMVSSGQPIASSKGKQLKRFLGKNEALLLAASIGDVQEKKVQSKMDRNHKSRPAQLQQIPKSVSRTKMKLKETKAMLVARRAQAKRHKVRSPKQQGEKEYQESSRDGKPLNTARKKVSFL